ncbi:peptide methionine sulfoxide reductase domain-containing protein [Ditylenchus destructor]|nr:peptide methionine sulfoxide reductase domain-containing protein [Ditylenchus destructor]
MASPLKRAYVGMQCFWGVESSFAKLSGVKKTRVGYAGGQMLNPTYANIGDHTEITELQYDEKQCTYKDLLDWFFAHHDPTVPHKKQYQSAILYVDDEQKSEAESALNQQQKKYGSKKVQTYLTKLDIFYQAEDYHQKYWLRCQRPIFNQLKLSEAEVVDSVLAAKLNAFMAGYDSLEVLKQLAEEYNLPNELTLLIESIARAGGDPRACH